MKDQNEDEISNIREVVENTDQLWPIKLKWWEKLYYPVYRLFNYHILYIHKYVWWKLQKFFRGFSDRDLWSLDWHLSVIILKRLKAFRKMNIHGYPTDFNSIEEWTEIIDKMILGFEKIIENDDNIDYGIKKCYRDKDGFIQFEYDESKRKLALKEHDKNEKAIEEGLTLFAKYFRNLWD